MQKKRVPITRIWNRLMNFGTGFMYPVLGTNHYCTGSVSEKQRNKDSKIGVNVPQG